MNFGDIFNLILYQPLFNILVLLYEYLPGHNFGVAVIILTLLIKFVFYPLGTQAIRAQKALNELQPKLQEIKEKYKNDKEKQAQATMELYQKAKINPFSGCLPVLIQLPILWALYRVFWQGFQAEQMKYLYSFVPHPGIINPNFLGIINLSQPNMYLAVLAGILQFVQTKTAAPKAQKQNTSGKDAMAQMGRMMQKQMLYIFPVITVMILWRLPSALGLYWLVTIIFSIIQQYLIFKKQAPVKT